MPANKTRMTLKSQTHKGDGFNELSFEDEAGQEEVFIHAQRNQNNVVKNNETTLVGNDRSEQVENDETLTVGHDRKDTVGNDEQVSIGRDRRHEAGQDDDLVIGRNHRIKTGKDRMEEVGNNRRDKTGASHHIEIGNHREEIVQGHAYLDAMQEIRHRTKTYRIQVEDEFVLEGPGGTFRINRTGIFLNGVALDFKGPMQLTTGGSGTSHMVTGVSKEGLAMDQVCGMRADGSCSRMPCPCAKGVA
ncbi:Rhs element Vgr protein [Pseudomonas putida]|uniref:Rhs element Vgr protein n=1 Tax=Pseudomonas putida TaxID=303 RepID=A0A177SA70_PSEPU|nr:Rhs element Vgr protein [Pseudomonas putida]